MCQIDIFYFAGFSMYAVVIYTRKHIFNATIVLVANTFATLALCPNIT